MRALLIDFGSTFTKAVVVDLAEERVVSSAKAPSTVDTDIRRGLAGALEKLGLSLSDLSDGPFEYKLACSSAAGGLKMVVVGLVPKYSAEAGRRAALTAGAKVIGVYS
ncbi:MAG: glutamate mutase L, partial [Candidatus Korarchaeota archaeon]|nr:glutamate mutase L [Candidatus Korarchaeota archaeon]